MQTFLDKLRFVRNTAFCLLAAQGAIIGYGEYHGYLDVRFYGTREQAYQARLHRAEAELARDAFSVDDPESPDVQLAKNERPKKHARSVWDALGEGK